MLAAPVTRCSYQHHCCTQPRLSGYQYCGLHILEDRAAPYRLCSYVYAANGRRCNIPTLKGERKDSGLCTDHARKAQLSRQRSSRRHLPPPTPETLLLSLSHLVAHTEPEKPSADETREGELDEILAETAVVTKTLNPFAEVDAYKVNAKASRVLDYASESDSDVDPTIMDGTWRGEEAESSDAESVSSQQEDYLKHAGVYTAEEVLSSTRDKLIRLQSLYIEQFRRLQHVLKERRRKYLHTLRREKETLCSIHNQPRETMREQKLFCKLKALNRYHKRTGIEAVLHTKALERRAMATEGVNVRPAPTAKCIFTEGGVKCGEKTLPSAKHCYRHVLQDPHQVLFRACGCGGEDMACREPVLGVFEEAACVYHTTLPPARSKGIQRPEIAGVPTAETSSFSVKMANSEGDESQEVEPPVDDILTVDEPLPLVEDAIMEVVQEAPEIVL